MTKATVRLVTKKTLTPAKQFASNLSQLPDEFIVCRDVRHSWDVLNDFRLAEQTSGSTTRPDIVRDLQCNRCTVVRHEIYSQDRYGQVEKQGQTYSYPTGYHVPGVPRGVRTSIIVQQEQYRRAIERAAGAAPGEHDGPER